MDAEKSYLNEIERDVLQEIMNISFGQAAAGISDVIDQHVTLTVPVIQVIPFAEVFRCIRKEIPDVNDMSMITQFFSGKFSGSSLLLFPHGEGKKLLRLFDSSNTIIADYPDVDVLEKEGLIEVSNIVIGACISKIAELLDDVVTYSPPRFFVKDQIHTSLNSAFEVQNSYAIYFKTVFHLEHFNASGYLFLISNDITLDWLKKAIASYLEKYA
ncbi:chemotaxis protein CheC [Chrysiogenes arsenatis]|uniref:chemotaxis protein CheC n=1 Tax=Chrysiogenes arsenatis TaxID=309797 RepID=UPI0004037D96|nr:chemotaxis protein CheC [Chrysiogenes arsenatis]